MTRYDFTTQPNRLNQNTMKWHEAESDPELLELWVADMDFLPVPEIRDAVINYAETHIFGYPYPSDELYQSIIDWEKINMAIQLIRRVLSLLKGCPSYFNSYSVLYQRRRCCPYQHTSLSIFCSFCSLE